LVFPLVDLPYPELFFLEPTPLFFSSVNQTLNLARFFFFSACRVSFFQRLPSSVVVLLFPPKRSLFFFLPALPTFFNDSQGSFPWISSSQSFSIRRPTCPFLTSLLFPPSSLKPPVCLVQETQFLLVLPLLPLPMFQFPFPLQNLAPHVNHPHDSRLAWFVFKSFMVLVFFCNGIFFPFFWARLESKDAFPPIRIFPHFSFWGRFFGFFQAFLLGPGELPTANN